MFMLLPEPVMPSIGGSGGVGGGMTGFIVIITLSGSLSTPSSFVTTSSNTSLWGRSVSGALKVGFSALGSQSYFRTGWLNPLICESLIPWVRTATTV